MQRCGIGGKGEIGAFKCLTPSTLSPAPDAGPFFESRSAHTGRPVLDDCLRSTSSVLRCRQKLLLRCVGTEGDGIRGVGSAAAEASHCLHE